MPPSTVYQLFKRTRCRQIQISTSLNIPPALLTKLKGRKKGRPRNLFYFATSFPGEGKVRVGHSAIVRRTDEKDIFEIRMFWFPTEETPPAEMEPIGLFEDNAAEVFGEREVDVRAEFSFNRDQIISFFKPIELGEQSQILDEIVGFKGVKRDREGKILYRMEITLSDKSIELELSFRQTVRVGENMPIALLETSSKISNLAIKPKGEHT